MPCPPLPSHGRATNALPRTRRPALPVSHVASAHEKPMSRRGEFEFFLFFFIGRGVWKKHNEGGQKRGRWEGVYHVNTWMMELRNRHPNNLLQLKMKDKGERERERERGKNFPILLCPAPRSQATKDIYFTRGTSRPRRTPWLTRQQRERVSQENFSKSYLPNTHTHAHTVHSPRLREKERKKKKGRVSAQGGKNAAWFVHLLSISHDIQQVDIYRINASANGIRQKGARSCKKKKHLLNG